MKTQNKWQRIGIILIAILIGVGVPEFLNSQNVTEVHSTDSTDNQEHKLDAVKFIRTVDGDTIIVEEKNGENKRVRMIGIDTPESVAQEEERNNEYGEMASEFTKSLLSNTDTLYLEYDVDADDQYDRVLAYVWLEDVDDTFNEENIENSMVNAIIIKNGYGVAKRYEPTVAHDDVLQSLMATAQGNETGLWQYEGFVALWD